MDELNICGCMVAHRLPPEGEPSLVQGCGNLLCSYGVHRIRQGHIIYDGTSLHIAADIAVALPAEHLASTHGTKDHECLAHGLSTVRGQTEAAAGGCCFGRAACGKMLHTAG